MRDKQGVEVLHKDSFSITDFSFCHKFSYGSE